MWKFGYISMPTGSENHNISASSALSLQVHASAPGFHVDARDLNLGPSTEQALLPPKQSL